MMGLGATDAFGRAAGVMLDPLYVELERRAVISIKEQVGPYVLGAFVGLMLYQIWLSRVLHKQVAKAPLI